MVRRGFGNSIIMERGENIMRWDKRLLEVFVSIFLAMILMIGAVNLAVAEEITLQFWVSAFTPESSKWYREVVIPEYEKLHPNIKIEYQEMGWGIDRTQKLITAFAAGAAPDVYEAGSEHIADMYLKGEPYPDFEDEFLSKWPHKDKIPPYAWYSSTWAGKRWGIPMYTEARPLVYRKSFFEEAGLDPNQPPQTWEQLKEYTEKLTIRDGKKLVRAGYDFSRLQGIAGVQEFMTFLWQNGGDYFDEDRNVTIDSPEGIETLAFMVELYQAVYPPGTAPLPAGVIPNFPAGKVAMGHGNWNIFQMLIYAPEELDDVGIGDPPVGRKRKVISTYTNWYLISSQSEHPEEAWELLQFLAEPENMGQLAGYLNAMPARSDALPIVVDKYPFIGKIAEMSEKYGEPNRVYPEYEQLNTILGDCIDAACMGKLPVEEAIKKVGEEWRKILAKAVWE